MEFRPISLVAVARHLWRWPPASALVFFKRGERFPAPRTTSCAPAPLLMRRPDLSRLGRPTAKVPSSVANWHRRVCCCTAQHARPSRPTGHPLKGSARQTWTPTPGVSCISRGAALNTPVWSIHEVCPPPLRHRPHLPTLRATQPRLRTRKPCYNGLLQESTLSLLRPSAHSPDGATPARSFLNRCTPGWRTPCLGLRVSSGSQS